MRVSTEEHVFGPDAGGLRIAVSALTRPEERLLAAAKTDNESLLQSALEDLKDINGVDGWVVWQRAAVRGVTDN